MKKIAIILTLALTTAAHAQISQQSTVDVRGEGIVNVVPDEVIINIRVEHTGKSTSEIKKENDAVMREVLKFINLNKIADKDVRTEFLNLSKNYDYNTKTYEFVANQSVSIKLRDLTVYETFMDGLLKTGINRIDGIQFSSSNEEQLATEARKKAVENAKSKAQEYASVLGQSVGKAVAISEFSLQNEPRPMFNTMASATMDASGKQASIAPGEMEIRATVNVSFILN